MADNTTLNTGAGGDTISTDDLGTVKVQRVKVQYGADGSATDVASGTPLPVTNDALGTDGSTLPTKAVQVGGTDGTNFQTVATNSAGNLQVGLSASIPAGSERDRVGYGVGASRRFPGRCDGEDVRCGHRGRHGHGRGAAHRASCVWWRGRWWHVNEPGPHRSDGHDNAAGVGHGHGKRRHGPVPG
jgi:hypothetical protein